jgi:hypothetical protein
MAGCEKARLRESRRGVAGQALLRVVGGMNGFAGKPGAAFSH